MKNNMSYDGNINHAQRNKSFCKTDYLIQINIYTIFNIIFNFYFILQIKICKHNILSKKKKAGAK